jgi:anthranilate phosphoribosyltransferase
VRILLIDHGCCDPPATRVHALRHALSQAGIAAAVCGPSSVPSLEQQPPGMFGIHLDDVAAASRRLLTAVRSGDATALLTAVATVPARLLGLVRETARQTIAEATDAVDPDAIFVLHGGILTDLAVETGAPVVVHLSGTDLTAAEVRPSLKRLVVGAVGSCGVVAAATEETAAALRRDWLGGDTEGRCEVWPIADVAAAAAPLAAACRRAIASRQGVL